MRYPFTPFTSEENYGEYRGYGYHNGIDLNGPGGGNSDLGTLLFPITDCLVTDIAESRSGYGKSIQVMIKGEFGFRWVEYDHCQEILVKKGQSITEDTPIAKLGNTGYSTAAHLHFVIRKFGHLFRTIAKTRAELGKNYEDPLEFVAHWIKKEATANAYERLMGEFGYSGLKSLRVILKGFKELQAGKYIKLDQHEKLMKEKDKALLSAKKEFKTALADKDKECQKLIESKLQIKDEKIKQLEERIERLRDSDAANRMFWDSLAIVFKVVKKKMGGNVSHPV